MTEQALPTPDSPYALTRPDLRFPEFLIVGAMKCGTTTLFMDLCAHPSVYMPDDKEPHNLCDDDVLTPQGIENYGTLFKPARPDQICGEASTGYSKIPYFGDVVSRTLSTLGRDLRIIYIIREPIARIVSHHYHNYANGACGPDIEQTIREDPRLVDYTRYATQIQPWIDAYGPQAVRIVRFESFVKDRRAYAADLHSFLGIDPRPDLIDPGAIHNKGEGKAVPRGLTGFLRTGLYKRFVRRVTPDALREWTKKTVLPRAPERPPLPSPDLVNRLIEELSPELDRLERIMGADAPIWDMDAVRARFSDASPSDDPRTVEAAR